MAKVAKNPFTMGLTGTVGDLQVFRQWGGDTIVAISPGERTTPPTPAQEENQQRFQQAVVYARSAISDPAKKAEYAAKADGRQHAFHVAVADFFHAPNISEVDLTDYAGQVGDVIRVRATDDFKVTEVAVTIVNSDGSEVESGTAVQDEAATDWIYTVTTENTEMTGDKIIVRASDAPHNVTENETTL